MVACNDAEDLKELLVEKNEVKEESCKNTPAAVGHYDAVYTQGIWQTADSLVEIIRYLENYQSNMKEDGSEK